MQIKEMFVDDINREINGVVMVDQDAEKVIKLSPIKSYHQSRQPPSECAAIVPSDGDFHFPNW